MLSNQGSIFDKMKAKAKAEKTKPTNAQDAIDEVKEELVVEAKAKQDLERTPPPTPPKKVKARTKAPASSTIKTDSKIQKEVKQLKDDMLQIRSLIAELTREIATNTPTGTPNRKLTFEEFVEHMLSHAEVGTHYSVYVKQYTGETTGTGRPKKSNFNHIYMIYLDLP